MHYHTDAYRYLSSRLGHVDRPLGVLEAQLHEVERHLKAIDREQQQLLQWALKGFPENQVEIENRRLNKARETLKPQKAELEIQIKASQDAVISIPKLESFIERMQGRIAALDFEGKRQVLDMLDITVWLDGESVEITGFLPVAEDVIATAQLGRTKPTTVLLSTRAIPAKAGIQKAHAVDSVSSSEWRLILNVDHSHPSPLPQGRGEGPPLAGGSWRGAWNHGLFAPWCGRRVCHPVFSIRLRLCAK